MSGASPAQLRGTGQSRSGVGHCGWRAVNEAVGESAFKQGCAAGGAMTMDEAIAYALDEQSAA
jgi:hypothetical protein